MLLAYNQETKIKDSTGTPIKVGDLLKTGENEYWDINTYLQAVPRHAAMALDIKMFIFQYPNAIILSKEESKKVEKIIGVPEIAKVSNLNRRRARTIVEKPEEETPKISHKADGSARGFKYCPHCKQMLETTEFYKCSGNADGYQAWCKHCVSNFYKEKGTSRRKYKRGY